MGVMAIVAAIGIWAGYDWSLSHAVDALAGADPEAVARLTEQAQQSPELTDLAIRFSAPTLLMHNSRVVLGILLAGLVSFSVLGIVIYLVNIGLIGGVFGLLQVLGLSPWKVFLAGVMPHGVLEIPALMLASAAVLRIGVVLVTPQTGRSMGDVLIGAIADWCKVVAGVVLPLLILAAAIEAYLTPSILLATLNR
jgi:stage II sporulation protein M